MSIDPEDANVSETYVPKEGEPPGPAQAAFNGLVPGRAYNISVETVSEGRISDPTTAQYRTVPLRPHNVTFDPETIGPDYFTVRWSGPDGISEFDRYQVTMFNKVFCSFLILIFCNRFVSFFVGFKFIFSGICRNIFK